VDNKKYYKYIFRFSKYICSTKLYLMTTEITWLQNAYQYYNDKLFYSNLPACIFTIGERSKYGGFMIKHEWANDLSDERIHQISLTKSLFNYEDEFIFSVLVHEMVHLWQVEFGKPSINRYHNREWAWKMKEVGLIPSRTGEKGGEEVGERMSHYVEENGRFSKVFKDMPPSCLPVLLPNIRRKKRPTPVDGRAKNSTVTVPKRGRTNKLKYECPSCNQKAYGGKNLNISCGKCNLRMTTPR